VGSLKVFEIYRTGNSLVLILILIQIPRPKGSLFSNVPKHAEPVVIKRDIQRTALSPHPPHHPHCKTHASRTDKLE